ncbi:MAG: PAS domain-containing protein [bacterium]|nr:PAS domain-containing protein [bacterium]
MALLLKKFRNLSIRDKLTAVIMIVTAFALALSYVAFIIFDRNEMHRSRILHLQTLARMIGYHSSAALTFDDASDAQQTLGSLAAENNVSHAWVFRKNGRRFAEYSRENASRPVESMSRIRVDSSYVAYGRDHIIVVEPVVLDGSVIGAVRLRSTLDDLYSRQRQYLMFGSLFTLLALGIAGTLASRLQKLVSGPIVALAAIARQVRDTQDYNVRGTQCSNDEVGELVTGFNEMLTEIESRDGELLRAHDQLEAHANQLSIELSERQRAERDAEQMRTFLLNIIDAMPSILVVVDSDLRVIQWNHEAEKATGVRREFANGNEVHDVFPVLSDRRSFILNAVNYNSRYERERVSMTTLEGDRFYDMMIYPLYTVGIDGVVIRLDDCTDRVRMEEMMIQTEKMMSVGGLAAGMAHEINNPLGIILRSAQNLKRRVSPDLAQNEEAARRAGTTLAAVCEYFEARGLNEFLKDISDAGKRAAAIVTNMLNFSRKTESSMQPTDIADLIRRSIELAASDYDLKKRYDFRHISLELELDDSMDKVRCIETKIEQVLLNLLKNAAQAMGEHGTTDPKITCRTRTDNSWAIIEVEDNGPGMTDSVRRRVFEPFFTTKEVGAGTGLGLSVSYFIITDNHRGQLEVDSWEGKGTRFTIRLPLTDNEPTTARANPEAEPNANNTTTFPTGTDQRSDNVSS